MNKEHWIYSGKNRKRYESMTQRYHILEELVTDEKGNTHIPRTYLCARTDNEPGTKRREGKTGLTRVYLD